MSGKNRHYLPRSFQGYFLEPEKYMDSYIKKEYFYYLSKIMTGERNILKRHVTKNWKGDYFRYSGSEIYGLNQENEKYLEKIEESEMKLIRLIHKKILEAENDILNINIANDFLNKTVFTLHVRSITDINKMRLIFSTLLKKNINNIIIPLDKIEKDKIEKIMKDIFIFDQSDSVKESYNFYKKIYNAAISSNIDKNLGLNFNNCLVLKTKREIPLTDIRIFSEKKNNYFVIEDISKAENIYFPINKNTVLCYTNNRDNINFNYRKVYQFLIKSAKDFMITTEEIDKKLIKKTYDFKPIFEKNDEILEEILQALIVECIENKDYEVFKKQCIGIIESFKYYDKQ